MNINSLSNQLNYVGEIEDFAEELKPSGVRNILLMVYEAYQKLEKSQRIKISMSEVDISEELYWELEGVWKEKGDSSIRPIPEKPHEKIGKCRGKTPTIDFCFRGRWQKDVYFGFECKLLADNDSARFKKYIDEGVNRYLSGTYGKNCSSGSMIGYIVNGNSSEIIKEVTKRINEVADISKTTNSKMIKGFSFHYISGHSRNIGFSPIYLHHLFFIFSVNVEAV